MKGHAGKILRVSLANKEIKTIETKRYEDWVGGNGLATAIWFDLVKDKAISGFDPRNTLVIAPGFFAGTLVPAASRTEMVGVQVQSYPTEWFTRSNVGGRFAPMLKYAGYDAITVEGVAESPMWISIVDGEAELKDARGLWGLDAYETQRTIFREVSGAKGFGGWLETGEGKRTTQRPAVLAIGPAGENKSRIASVTHDASCAFGQGGFGGVWGAKKLKAISAWGSGSVDVAEPEELIKARLWAERSYGTDFDDPKIIPWMEFITSHFSGYLGHQWAPFDAHRPYSCIGCHLACKPRTASGFSNEAICVVASIYQWFDIGKHGAVTYISGKASDLLSRLGVNAFEARSGLIYIKNLYDKGVLGKGKAIDTDLPFDEMGEVKFFEEYLYRLAHRVEIGDALAEGFPRAAERWGRLEEDLKSGLHPAMFWGYPKHYDARTEVYWGYSSIVSGRDINSHDFNVPSYRVGTQYVDKPFVTAEQVASIIAEKCAPFNDPLMMDFSDENIYSEHMAKTTAWLLYYSFFWKQTCGLCDNAFADFLNPYGADGKGITPEGERRFFKAVTGKDLGFAGGIELGRKIWNLNKAILVLQGRHRDMEELSPYVYSMPSGETCKMPARENGKWVYKDMSSRVLDRKKFEEWKTKYYELEGWDSKTGWPTRKTLEALGLKHAADELEKRGKLP